MKEWLDTYDVKLKFREAFKKLDKLQDKLKVKK